MPRLRWTFHPPGALFIVYNHNLVDPVEAGPADTTAAPGPLRSVVLGAIVPVMLCHTTHGHAATGWTRSGLAVALSALASTTWGCDGSGSPAAGAAPAEPTVERLAVPQNALDVRVDGFRIVPPMGLGSWAVFARVGDTTTVMGDLVVLPSEVLDMERALVDRGLTVTALHNHFVRAEPPVMFMHIEGRGAPGAMREAVEAVVARVAELRGADPAATPAPGVPNTLDTAAIARALGHGGELSGGVYRTVIGRPDVVFAHGGVRVTTAMGLNTWAAWQGTPDRAAVAGDFVMLKGEVAAVIDALVRGGIEVVAVHQHMVHEEPRALFLHYWGVGRADDLARTLRAALERTGGTE